MSDSGLKVTLVKDEIPNSVLSNTLLNISTREVNSYTHGFHKYPAKFIPQVPRWAIRKYLKTVKSGVIFDPFCGSGTTLVESSLAGHSSIGIDIDPLSVLISKVKTTKLNLPLLAEVHKWIISELTEKPISTFVPACTTIDHWFTEDAILKLGKIRTIIDNITKTFGEDEDILSIQNLFLICLSSIIRKVSKADNESQKTYVSHTKIKLPVEVNSLYLQQMILFIERISMYSASTVNQTTTSVINSSSSKLLSDSLINSNIDLVVTSPPYIKSVDYVYNQMIELFWIGDRFGMETQSNQNKLKVEYVGTKQVTANLYKNFDPHTNLTDIKILDDSILKIIDEDSLNGQKHSYITFKYFQDMDSHFEKVSKLLITNTPYVLVIGNSTVSGVNINTADILIKIAQKYNFKLVNKWGYLIKNRFMRFNRMGRGGIIEIDWVIELVKN